MAHRRSIVQHAAGELRLLVGKLLHGVHYLVARGVIVPHDVHYRVRAAADELRVGDYPAGRRIENDVVIVRTQPLYQLLQLMRVHRRAALCRRAAYHLKAAPRHGREHRSNIYIAVRHIFWQAGARIVHADGRLRILLSEVGVDKHRPQAGACQRQGEICGNGGLALAW